MMNRVLALLLLSTTAAQADAPIIATDIAPVHSLVSQVMQGVGEPTLLMKQGASPHGYSLRPSEARALQNADIVIWVGEELTPWLAKAVDSVAQDAVSMPLLDVPGFETFEFRETAIFGEEDHDDDHDHGDEDHAHEEDHDHDEDHAHEEGHDADHDDHAHEEDHDHNEDHAHEDDHDDDHHDHAHHDDHHHDHDGVDPHAWLDVDAARVWVAAIADKLAEIDPANAAVYQSNAVNADLELAQLSTELKTQLAPYQDARFVLFHDAYQYFEHANDLHAIGALQLSDATPPSAAHIAAIQAEITEHGVTCIFSEPQFSDALVHSVATDTTKTAELDPLGVDVPLGTDFYGELLRNLADNIEGCLK